MAKMIRLCNRTFRHLVSGCSLLYQGATEL